MRVKSKDKIQSISNHNRDDLKIHKFPEPVVLLEDIQIDSNDIETIKIAWPDRNYDCEGMVVDPETLDILLFTKHSTSDVARVPSGSSGEVSFNLFIPFILT